MKCYWGRWRRLSSVLLAWPVTFSRWYPCSRKDSLSGKKLQARKEEKIEQKRKGNSQSREIHTSLLKRKTLQKLSVKYHSHLKGNSLAKDNLVWQFWGPQTRWRRQLQYTYLYKRNTGEGGTKTNKKKVTKPFPFIVFTNCSYSLLLWTS